MSAVIEEVVTQAHEGLTSTYGPLLLGTAAFPGGFLLDEEGHVEKSSMASLTR